jgi:hypothetical protein
MLEKDEEISRLTDVVKCLEMRLRQSEDMIKFWKESSEEFDKNNAFWRNKFYEMQEKWCALSRIKSKNEENTNG